MSRSDRWLRVFAFVLMLLPSLPATACLWDYDTLAMERVKFPGALELIAGKFLRHSPEFYAWREGDRRRKLAAADGAPLADTDLARLYDDWAVSLDKLGRHDEAIAAIDAKATWLPRTGRYETLANRGTFLVHDGRFEEGLRELRAAIRLNPDAHFGRERYQILLVEYLLQRQAQVGTSGVPQPLEGSEEARFGDDGGSPFAAFVLTQRGLRNADGEIADRTAATAELARATKGVLGMMQFGDYRSPVLLEALGDLLLANTTGETNRRGQRLAARAYLRAAEAAATLEARDAYRRLAQAAIASQRAAKDEGENGPELTLKTVEGQLRREVQEADVWFETVADDERFWIKRSPDPEARYWQKYQTADVRIGHDRQPAGRYSETGIPWPLRAGLAGGLAAVFAGIAGLTVWRRRRPTGYDNPDDATA